MKSKRRLGRMVLLTVLIVLTMFCMMLSFSAMLIMLIKTLIIVMALTMMFQQDEGVWRKEKKGGGDPPTLKYFIAFNKVNKDESKGTYVYMNGIFSSLFSWMRRHLWINSRCSLCPWGLCYCVTLGKLRGNFFLWGVPVQIFRLPNIAKFSGFIFNIFSKILEVKSIFAS